ncbi:MAG: helix-turn-helix transcriptional regulator [Acidimicrobiia bacterium]|nr:helix-turn-helix transcriptional regulator [Acidimicrobiia bacterium]
MRLALVQELASRVGFESYAWVLTDAETEVGSAPLADTPSVADVPRLIRAKYLTPTNRWTSLAGSVATLVGATGGDAAQSLVWREVLSSYSVVDVASVVFRDQHGCWAWLDLWRSGGTSPFIAAEQAYLQAVAGPVTEALRSCQARTFQASSPLARSGPAVLLLSPSLEVKAQTAETEAYLRALVPPDGDRRPIPAGAYHVAAQLLAVEAGVDSHEPSARVHLRDGIWMTLRAARVADASRDADQDIAVTIEPTSPAERRSLFARSHAFTARETELVGHLAAGADTRTIAEELFVSEHTVQDHLKSIFAKTGARNRRTLLTRLTGR